jgi:hypothetical protein
MMDQGAPDRAALPVLDPQVLRQPWAAPAVLLPLRTPGES